MSTPVSCDEMLYMDQFHGQKSSFYPYQSKWLWNQSKHVFHATLKPRKLKFETTKNQFVFQVKDTWNMEVDNMMPTRAGPR